MCNTPFLIIHKTEIKPSGIKDTIKMVRELRLIKIDEMEKFEEYYQGVNLKDTIKIFLQL